MNKKVRNIKANLFQILKLHKSNTYKLMEKALKYMAQIHAENTRRCEMYNLLLNKGIDKI